MGGPERGEKEKASILLSRRSMLQNLIILKFFFFFISMSFFVEPIGVTLVSKIT